jgi:predicted ATPase
VPIGGRQLRLLLTLLALDAGRVVPAPVLAGRLWPGAEAERGNALQTLVSRLRAALRETGTDGLIESHPTGYRLAVPPEAVDALVFAELAAEGRRALAGGDAARASRELARALDLWRGQPLADAAGCEYADAVALRLSGVHEEAVLNRLEAELTLGAAASLTGELKAIVEAGPLAERPRALLMRALYADGRQAEALASYAQARELLAEQLGADPSPALEEVYLRILRGESQSEQPVVRASVPATLTSFVGRDEELTQLRKLLGSGRLITLTGPGGVGKTRLAAEIAGRLDGPAWFVPLAPVSDPDEVPYTVLDVLGIRGPVIRVGAEPIADPLDRLSRTLAERDDVLILDNCEHVVEAAADLAARLLSSCPRLRIVATSREPLRTDGENLLPVPPLPFPRRGEDGNGSAESYPSVRLLCDRAGAVRPGFTLDDRNAAAIARVCRALDGMPLAIELAAVWLRVLSAEQLAERLDDRFALLTGGSRTALPRHQTLRAVVDWSWELLSEPERILARRLSLFPAGATLEAAEQVCAGDGLAAAEVLTVLSGVVDKSILAAVHASRQATGQAGTRYVMLETVRAYCLERLSAAEETRRYRDSFSAYYLALAERADPELRGRDQVRWTRRILAEQDNLYAALRWAVSQRDADTAYRMVRALGWYWMLRGQPGDSRSLATDVLALDPPDGSLRIVEARLICGLTKAGSAWDLDAVRDVLSGAAGAFTAMVEEDPTAALHPLAAFGPPILALVSHEPDRAVAMFERYQQTSDPWLRAAVPFFRGMFGGILGRVDEAEEACRGALGVFRELGDSWGTAAVLIQLADFAKLRGDFAAGIAALEEAEALGGLLEAWDDLTQIGGLMAILRMRSGDLAGARVHLDRSISLSAAKERRMGDAAVWFGLTEAELLWCQGDLDAASRQCDEVIALLATKRTEWYAGTWAIVRARQAMIAQRLGDRDRCRELLAEALGRSLDWVEHPPLAAVIDAVAAFAAPDDPRSAAAMLGVAHTVRGAFDESSLDAPAVREAAREALGLAGFDEAYRHGSGLSSEDGIALARGFVTG